MSAPPLRLHDLPYDVLVHSLLPLFAAHELAKLRLVNREIKLLVDEEHIWKGMIQQDFNFPSHASSRRSGWQTLYRGLSRPTVFVWGQYSNARLGIPPEELKDELQQFISRYGGATFPLKLPYNLQAQEAGPPVEIVAGGWSFHCLTAKGEILFHGQLDGFQYGVELSSPGCKVSPPRVLKRATKDAVKALSCGRAHGVALTAQQDILEWHNWSLAVKHERLIQLASPNPTWIAQLEAGWDCTAVLLHSRDGESVKRSEVVWWYTQSVDSGRLAQDGPDGENTTWLGVQRSVLPPLPDVSEEAGAELDEMDHKNHSLIVRLAAGESWIVALTASGLLYRVELRPEHPNQRQEWILLDNFCLPSKIAQLDYFANGPGTSKGLINSNLRITHINAQFRNFAAYTPSSSTEGGIVLLGNSDSGEGSRPIIKPELQGAGVIKVSMGDWHFGALTTSGKVMTWGQWSAGALGTWDSLQPDTPPPQAARAAPTFRGQGPGRGPGPVAPRTTAEEDEPHLPEPLGHNPFPRVRLGLAAARGGFRNGVRQHVHRPTPTQDTTPSTLASAASTSLAGRSDPWADRLKPRRVPRSIEEATIVQFDPAKPDKDFVFDIAFAGWHSAAIAIPAGLVRGTGSSDGDDDGTSGQEEEEEAESTTTIDSFQKGAPLPLSRSSSFRLFSSTAPAPRRRQLNGYTFDADPRILQTVVAERQARRIFNLSLGFLLVGILTFVGGWERVFPLYVGDATGEREGGGRGGVGDLLGWPHSLLNFLPLMIPLTLYLVIARWTGRQLYGGFAG